MDSEWTLSELTHIQDCHLIMLWFSSLFNQFNHFRVSPFFLKYPHIIPGVMQIRKYWFENVPLSHIPGEVHVPCSASQTNRCHDWIPQLGSQLFSLHQGKFNANLQFIRDPHGDPETCYFFMHQTSILNLQAGNLDTLWWQNFLSVSIPAFDVKPAQTSEGTAVLRVCKSGKDQKTNIGQWMTCDSLQTKDSHVSCKLNHVGSWGNLETLIHPGDWNRMRVEVGTKTYGMKAKKML